MTRYLPAKLVAFLMSLYVFLAGIPYGDEPVKVDFTATPEKYEYEIGERIRVYIEGENVGRPFIGEKNIKSDGSPLYYARVSFFREVDGREVYLVFDTDIFLDHSVPSTGLIKHGEEIKINHRTLEIDDRTDPGVYNMKVTVYGCTEIYENAIVVK